ncbi:MAG: hypothetical protein HXX20_13935 [Chloroflexi bacterium]|nr:hypothetical protein [Chloroflexota bacterium]
MEDQLAATSWRSILQIYPLTQYPDIGRSTGGNQLAQHPTDLPLDPIPGYWKINWRQPVGAASYRFTP